MAPLGENVESKKLQVTAKSVEEIRKQIWPSPLLSSVVICAIGLQLLGHAAERAAIGEVKASVEATKALMSRDYVKSVCKKLKSRLKAGVEANCNFWASSKNFDISDVQNVIEWQLLGLPESLVYPRIPFIRIPPGEVCVGSFVISEFPDESLFKNIWSHCRWNQLRHHLWPRGGPRWVEDTDLLRVDNGKNLQPSNFTSIMLIMEQLSTC